MSSPNLSLAEHIPCREFREAIYAVHCLVEAPLPLILNSALSAISIAGQHLFNVNCPGRGESPISLNTMTIAESGDRKTAADGKFMTPIYEFEERIKNQQTDKKRVLQAKHKVWKAHGKKLDKILQNAVDNEDSDAEEIIQEQLVKHFTTEPLPENPFRIMYERSTCAAFLQNLSTGWKSVAFCSNEGGTVLLESTTDTLLCLNKLWDGESIRVDRVTRPSIEIKGVRVTCSIMAQKAVLDKFIKKGREIARASGYLARYLIAYPESMQGHRLMDLTPEDAANCEKKLKLFQEKVNQLLENSLELNGHKKIVLHFSAEAITLWRAFYIEVEKSLGKHGPLNDISDFASKICNILSRLTAVLHITESTEGEINARTTALAISLAREYIVEFKKLFGIKDSNYIIEQNAYILNLKILEIYNNPKYKFITRSDCKNRSPLPRQDKDAFDAAFDRLISTGMIQLQKINGITVVTPKKVGFACSSQLAMPEKPAEIIYASNWNQIIGCTTLI